jgi:hypothetical protein
VQGSVDLNGIELHESAYHRSSVPDWHHYGATKAMAGRLQVSRETDTILGQGTMLEPSTPYIGKGVALVAQAAAPVYPRVYRCSTISDSRNDHSSFP